MGIPSELQGKTKVKWEKSKSTELSSLISKYLSKLLSELDATASESESRFDHLLSKLKLSPLD